MKYKEGTNSAVLLKENEEFYQNDCQTTMAVSNNASKQ